MTAMQAGRSCGKEPADRGLRGRPIAGRRPRIGSSTATMPTRKAAKRGSRNREVVIREVLLEAVTVREGDTVRQMPALEAVLKKTLAKALAGDGRATLTIIGIAQKEGILTTEQEQVVHDLSKSDLAILQDVKRRLEASTLAEAPAALNSCNEPIAKP
jgi:hypothetical protein